MQDSYWSPYVRISIALMYTYVIRQFRHNK
nr:MAG TPA: hypothetical protein [Caudoviricetes sp.]DAR61006.1 MAG TPA: hypothetical protein [Caudoviricetes sp.]DAU89564.1 MAG TPA: hypothetical protein [Caudoviricetes sp.]